MNHVPAVKEVVPASPVPVLDRAGGDVANVTAGLASGSQSTLILSQSIGFAKVGEVVVWSVVLLKGIYLLEEVEVALVTAFERLVSLFAVKDLRGTLEVGQDGVEKSRG